jgi:hypothetical protein
MTKKKAEQKTAPKTAVFDTKRAGHNGRRDRFQKFADSPQPHLRSDVVKMTPKFYMKMVEKFISKKFVASDRVQRILKIRLDQNKPNSWAMPVLDLTTNEYVGMNRAIACDKYGIAEIPVLVVAFKDADIKGLTKKD